MGQVVMERVKLVDEEVLVSISTGNGQKRQVRKLIACGQCRQVHLDIRDFPVVGFDVDSIEGTGFVHDFHVARVRIVQEPTRQLL